MIPMSVLIKCACKVETNEGNTYYKIPYWFEISDDGEDIIVHGNMPEDLSNYVTKAGLGGDNPKIKKPEV